MIIRQQIVTAKNLRVGSRVMLRDKLTKETGWYSVQAIQENGLLMIRSLKGDCVMSNISVSSVIDAVV